MSNKNISESRAKTARSTPAVRKSRIVRERKYELQGNDISNGIYNCSALARRLIAFCVSNAYRDTISLADVYGDEKLTKDDKLQCLKSSFSFAEFYERMGMARGGTSNRQVEDAVDECMRTIIKIEQTDEETGRRRWVAYSWFVESYFDEDAEKIVMTFNPLVYKAIVSWYFSNKGYSAMRLELLGSLRSFYAMRYYEMALSQMGNMGKNGNSPGTWWFERSIEELKTMFELGKSKSYERNDVFIQKVVKNPIEELNEKNVDFRVEVEKITDGRRTVGFRFWCAASSETVRRLAGVGGKAAPPEYTAPCPVCGATASLFYPCKSCGFDMERRGDEPYVSVRRQIHSLPVDERALFDSECDALAERLKRRLSEGASLEDVLSENSEALARIHERYGITG